MRRAYIAGNWKMNCTIAEAVSLAEQLVARLPGDANADVAVIPPFLAIAAVRKALAGSPIAIGAQDVYFEKNGAFTGEISTAMLKDAGLSFALVGHSERRHVIGETDAIVRRKLDALLADELDVILCIGEKLEEREAGQTEAVLERQITAGIMGLTAAQLTRVTIAYEHLCSRRSIIRRSGTSAKHEGTWGSAPYSTCWGACLIPQARKGRLWECLTAPLQKRSQACC
mgnify:CR=1 FL=1